MFVSALAIGLLYVFYPRRVLERIEYRRLERSSSPVGRIANLIPSPRSTLGIVAVVWAGLVALVAAAFFGFVLIAVIKHHAH
jgi:hypothetical protein